MKATVFALMVSVLGGSPANAQMSGGMDYVVTHCLAWTTTNATHAAANLNLAMSQPEVDVQVGTHNIKYRIKEIMSVQIVPQKVSGEERYSGCATFKGSLIRVVN